MKPYIYYTSSLDAWHGISRAVEKAERSIYIEMYIFVDDMEEIKNFVSLLATKAKAGIKVRLIFDGFGSLDISTEAIRELEDAGAEIVFFKKLFFRMHRKIVIIDEKIGFIGGVNFHKAAAEWDDLLLQIEGPVVNSLLYSFTRTYKKCGGRDKQLLNLKKPIPKNDSQVWFIEHMPFTQKPCLRGIYTRALLGARKKITIVSPYFMPPPWLHRLLKRLAKKGIEIEVIVPHTTDSGFITRANRYFMNRLTRKGVTFLLTPKMNHGKLLLIDNNFSCVGSQNIDSLSFAQNAEAAICFNDIEMIEELQTIIDVWKINSEVFNGEEHFTFIDRMVSYIVRLIHPIL